MAGDGNLERIGAGDAMRRARLNPLRRYPAPDHDPGRLYPLANPQGRAGFTIAPTDSIFAIGSCFARNIERALSGQGLDVVSHAPDLGQIGESLNDSANFLNKYSIHSVLNELRWALDRDSFPAEELLYPLADGYAEPQLGMARLDFDPEDILDFRHACLDLFARAATADVVILTLGYVECWYDRVLGLYLNVMPPVAMVKAWPERFEFRVLSHADILQALEDLHALLTAHRDRPLKMLVTVSPVPLLATFRDMDVLVANAYSKAVQRAAIEEFVAGRPDVDYFPSYEFVTLSDHSAAYGDRDFRHVSDAMVNRIMDNVLATYLDGYPPEQAAAPGPERDALLAELKLCLRRGLNDEGVSLVEANRALADADPEILLYEATLARRGNDLAGAFDTLARAHELAPNSPEALERMIMLCRPMRRRKAARELLSAHEKDFPARDDFRAGIDWL